ncbi:MAG TPA: DUF3857 domain-containing protein [Mucilaginibacter sp.]|nr:DUF3857 domain-containing protein [Mucilaginibacter sp.]
MKLFGAICCFVTLSAAVHGQQNYDASLISKDLLSYASSVVRNEEITVEIKDLDNAIYHVKRAITVLNKNGDEDARIVIYHDKSEVIKGVRGVVYDQFGKQIDKFSESKFDDVSVGSGSLFDSERAEHYLPAVTQYPYTIVYEYEEKLKQTLNLPSWTPNEDEGIAVEKSSYTFICKPDFKIKYRERNLPSGVVSNITKDGLKTYSWQVSNLKALRHEPFSPYYQKYISSVSIAPEKFIYYGINGAYQNWNDLGKWIENKLMANRQDLPFQTVEYVKELTQNITDPKLKAKKIYEYMQSKTHYISVQVGIGGFQPFLASDVDQQNYGDCKALVNYTQALLKAVGIDSYYCIVKSGHSYNVSLDKDFASMDQADHIILCVPFKNDTTWADCTSQTIPFGYLGGFTDNRTVLALTPDGGKLLHTPQYTASQNLQSRQANFEISANGQLEGEMTTVFKGVNYEDRDELIKEPEKEQYKFVQKYYPINNMDIGSLKITRDKSFDPSTTETIKLKARDYATFTGDKYYFMLNPANRQTSSPRPVSNRQHDVSITRGYTEQDSIIFTIPAGYHLEKRPLNINLKKPFGSFIATMILQGNTLTFKRTFQLIGGLYNKDTYQDLVDFFQDVVDADQYNVVLVKNT